MSLFIRVSAPARPSYVARKVVADRDATVIRPTVTAVRTVAPRALPIPGREVVKPFGLHPAGCVCSRCKW